MAVSVAHVAIAVLLGLTVLIETISCVGILAVRRPLQRLHFAGLASMVCPVLVALAVAISKNPLSGAGLKALFIAVVAVGFAPVLSHAAGRAVLARSRPGHF